MCYENWPCTRSTRITLVLKELVVFLGGIFERVKSPNFFLGQIIESKQRFFWAKRNLKILKPKSKIYLFKASALWADAFYKSICPSVCPSVHVSVCLFTFEVPFNSLFAPTTRSRMSNIFRDSGSLGKSNGKKWSQI